MKNIFLLILVASSFATFSQSNFTVFNNGGQSFYVILNGIKQNSLPQTNVVVGGLKNSAYAVKLIFADGKTADIDKNFFIENPSDITTKIIFKKGKGKLQLISMEPTLGFSTSTSVITYRPDNSAIFSDAVVVPVSNSNTNSGTITTVETTTTQTTTTNQGTNGQGNTTIVVNDNTNPANVNMNISTNATPTNGNVSMNMNTNTVPTNGNVNMNVGVNTNANQTTTNTGNASMNVGVNTNANQTTTNTGNASMNVGINTNANQMTTNTGNVNMNVGISETNTNTNGANVTMNVTDPMSGQQMNVNMNINATGTITETSDQMNLNTTNVNTSNVNGTVVTSTNTTTTTTTTSSNTSGNTTGNVIINQGTNNNTTNQNTNQNTTLITGNKITCNKTLNNLDAFIVELNDQSFEEDRLEALQLALVNTCLYTAQAEKLVDLFTFSEYKLGAAKFLSDRLMDRDNATAIAKHFNFEEDKMEYRRYISGKN